jgi:DNA-directed RNA polymerase subunit RPC12/RpoP
MPPGAIKADLSKQAPHNSYGPPMWYVDQKRTCLDCGKEFAWTAKKQQHWFEVLKLPIHVQAVRCPACSRKVRLAKAAHQAHMAAVARRPKHPKEAFFKSSSRREAKSAS